MPTRIPGLFITGTDTDVGKTYVAALIARALVASGRRVGVYKPAASGCRREGGKLVSDDAVALWEAASRPGELDRVCPQRFAAPLAPHLAAKEGKELDRNLLRQGIDYWRDRSEIILVEGAGGLLSPLGDDLYVANLAEEFGFPLVVVSRNGLGTINQTLQTLVAAARLGPRAIPVAGVVLNHVVPPSPEDESLATNRQELVKHCAVPVLAEIPWSGGGDWAVDWYALADTPRTSS